MNFFYNPATWKVISMSISLVFSLFLSCSIQVQENVGNSRPTLDPITYHTTRFSTDIRYNELNSITPGEEADQEVSIDARIHFHSSSFNR